MKRLLIALLFAGLLFPTAGVDAAVRVKTEPSVSIPQVEGATVNVYCTYRAGRKNVSSTGSGVFVGTKGAILTNAHVILPLLMQDAKGEPLATCHIRTGSPAKNAYRAELLYLDPAWITKNLETIKERTLRGTGEGDFALLYVPEAPAGTVFPGVPVPYVYAPITEAQEVVLAGYPAEKLGYKSTAKRLAYDAVKAEVLSLYSFLNPFVDMVTVSPTRLSQSGVSGGPVARSSGELLGLMTAVEGAKKKEERRLRAITLSYIDRMVSSSTGTPLALLVSGDLKALSAKTAASLPHDLLRDITKAQLKIR